MIKKYFKWQFSSLAYLQEGILSHEKSTEASPSPIITQILGNKIDVSTGRQSKSTKTEDVFFLSARL